MDKEYTAAFSWKSFGHFTYATTKVNAKDEKQALSKAVEWFAVRYGAILDDVKIYQALKTKAA